MLYTDICIFIIKRKYTRLSDGYMGQPIEWPQVVTAGKDLDECSRTVLRDAYDEMVHSYNELGKEIPLGNAFIEQLTVDVDHVRQAA